jgi:putative ABC transport system permease protein
MARRDLRRDRGRSAFVWLMIAVPIALIAVSQVLLASMVISVAEWTELRVGDAQARLTWVGRSFSPGVDGMNQTVADPSDTAPAAPPPGWGDTIASREQAVSALVGQKATAITTTEATFGPSGLAVNVLGLDANRAAARPMVRLVSGRLPAAPGEAAVAAAGLREGLPSSGTVTLRRETGGDLSYQLVGTVETRLDGGYGLVAAPAVDADTLGFQVSGDRPVTWADAQQLASRGFETTSRDLVAHPPPDADTETDTRLYYGGLVGAGGLLEVALLVGPAFAIGAARQRRSLALAATNGATTRQLRRAALGQAVLLGSSAALVGVAVGTAAGALAWPVISSDPTEIHGPLEVPWAMLVVLVLLGLLTALASALVTVRGLGRLDLVAALRGVVRSAPPRRGAPVVGALLVAIGLSAAWLAGELNSAGMPFAFAVWFGGAVAAIAGVLVATPALLRLLARMSGSTTVALRMAVRDLARQRGRATATVASVVGGALLLGTSWTMLLSMEADEARMYISRLPAGQGTIETTDGTDAGLAGIEEAVHGAGAGLRTARVGAAVGLAGAGNADDQLIVVARPGCTASDLLADDVPARCRALVSDFNGGILVASLDDLTSLFELDDAQARALAHGELLVNTDPVTTRFGTDRNEVVGGRVPLAYLDQVNQTLRTFEMPATAVDTGLVARGAAATRYSALVTTSTAAQRHWQVLGWSVQVIDPSGPLGEQQEQRINAALSAGQTIRVERGFVPTPQPVMWLITGTLALLAVIGAAMSTILATAELRPFLATFAAVGASPSLSRRIAAFQAAVLALVASVFGSALGLVAGAPLARSQTTWGGRMPPIVALPWLVVAILVVAVPLVAAGVAAVSTPARPVLARRTT